MNHILINVKDILHSKTEIDNQRFTSQKRLPIITSSDNWIQNSRECYLDFVDKEKVIKKEINIELMISYG
jgi:hypothetical protein